MTCYPLAVDAEHHQLNIAPGQDTNPIGLHNWNSHVTLLPLADDAEHHQLYIPTGSWGWGSDLSVEFCDSLNQEVLCVLGHHCVR